MSNKIEYNRSIRAMADIHDGHTGHHSDSTWRIVKNDYRTIQLALSLMKKYKISSSVTIFDSGLTDIKALDYSVSDPDLYKKLEKEYMDGCKAKDNEYSGFFGKSRESNLKDAR